MTRSSTTPIVVAGPTASGKSEAVLALAAKLDGEIISVDSMQVYRGLDIGSAKPSPEERRQIPHHLIDVAEIHGSFDAARFVTLAREALHDIQQRGKRPILCGGTGLYFTALRQGLGHSPPSDAALRQQLESSPLEELLQELAAADPSSYRSIDRRNPRRVVRAVEVIRLTGLPFSAQRAAWAPTAINPEPWIWLGLRRPAPSLHDRISRRVDQMFSLGLLAETERLVAAGLEQNRTAMQAIGYRQVVEYLRGRATLPETIELVKIRTRQFAKRQMTWMRKYLPSEWIDVSDNEHAASVTERILDRLQNSASPLRDAESRPPS